MRNGLNSAYTHTEEAIFSQVGHTVCGCMLSRTLRLISIQSTTSDLVTDLIVSRGLGEPLLAVEIKSDAAPRLTDVSGLKSFAADYPATNLQCWCQTRTRYKDNGVEFLPWREGLAGLHDFVIVPKNDSRGSLGLRLSAERAIFLRID